MAITKKKPETAEPVEAKVEVPATEQAESSAPEKAESAVTEAQEQVEPEANEEAVKASAEMVKVRNISKGFLQQTSTKIRVEAGKVGEVKRDSWVDLQVRAKLLELV
jgi:hypothetical protein